MTIEARDSRRLTGPNLIDAKPGAVIDAACPEDRREELVESWRDEVTRLLRAVGWSSETVILRTFPGGANLFISAPVDALYAATEVNEAAFEAASARIEGRPVPGTDADRLREVIATERNPSLMKMREAASAQGVTFLSDDDEVSVGLGRGSRTFPAGDVPSPETVDWESIHDIPLALVTGTNGKTTTVRLLDSIAGQAGKTAGMTCTDGIEVGGESIDSGDYSGPGGARTALRDRRVEVAFLETARGGMLRRGLGVERADAALVTNVGEDHLGEWGVADFDALVETKLVVRRAIRAGGLLVLNAEDDELRRRGTALDLPMGWYSTGTRRDEVKRHTAGGGSGAFTDDRRLFVARNGNTEGLLAVADLPIALGGAARHNISNALAAALVARTLGFTAAEIVAGLQAFTGNPDQNPGRGNLFDLGGVTVVVDFAHNPHGFRALFEMAAGLPAKRRLVLLGQAGDRDDDSIRKLIDETWKARPDRIVIKEMKKYLRGRPEGEVAGMIESGLRGLGAGDDVLERAESEMAGARSALNWSKPGDLLLLLSHADRTVMLKLMARLEKKGWKPGEKLP